MANVITGIRIICSLALLFCPALSLPFYVCYSLAGLSDIFDGLVARKTKTESDFGSKFDTVADVVFTAVCLVKLIPVLDFTRWMFIWLAVIAFVKIVNVISGFVMRKKFVAVHSVMNKITGCLLFALPFTLAFIELKYGFVVVASVATFSAVQEGHFIRTGKIEEKG